MSTKATRHQCVRCTGTCFCMLHSTQHLHGDGFNDEWIDGTEQTQQDPSVTNSTAATTNSTGESIRQVLMDYFVQHPR